MKYIVGATHPWNKRLFEETISRYPGDWCYEDNPANLTLERVKSVAPRYIFFLHWSWKVPDEIVRDFECVCFHMTDVPYGRGGSPLQNLIVRGHTHSKVTALRMVEQFDAGPVYLKEDLCLEGSAEEIYIRASELSARMIKRIIGEQIAPVPQKGEPTVFQRRKPGESEIPPASDLQAVYDHIRMLDAEGYPRAFLNCGGLRYEFSRATLRAGCIVADVSITLLDNESK